MTAATMRRCKGWSALGAFFVVLLTGCGGEQNAGAGAEAARETAAPAASAVQAGSAKDVDCPAFLTTEQVTQATGLPMKINLAARTELGTVCQWNAADDSSITASFRTYEGEDVAIFESEAGRAASVAGFGDAAFQRPASGIFPAGTLYVRRGDLHFEIDAWDTNQTGRLDVDATRTALARIVLGDPGATPAP